MDRRTAPNVLVVHPGRQHSHQLALALEDEGWLAGYWTGVPARPLTTVPGLRSLLSPLEKHDLLPIGRDRVRHNLAQPVLRRVAESLLPSASAAAVRYRGLSWFDRWCARRLSTVRPDAVVAYENSALHTFERARELGIVTVLDAASFHYAWQDRYFDYIESDVVHKRVTSRKGREIELADHVLTVSDMARSSYVDAGVPAERVESVPVGCDLSRFQASTGNERTSAAPFTFICAGHLSRRKGVDLLLQASRRLRDDGVEHRLWLAGGADDDVPWADAPHADVLGRLPQRELAERFRQADCLVLPSRHDSFGMVVVEAMASGVPVVVSDQVGAKEAVSDRTGWVIPADDLDALTEQMRWCVRHADAVDAMRDDARAAARRYSWDAYHDRVRRFFGSILG